MIVVKRILNFSLILLLLAGLFIVGGCEAEEAVVEPENDEPVDEPIDMEIVVGSKEYTEQLILGQIAILALDYNGIPTVDETGLGGTMMVREALDTGDVDLYWEYTGTALIAILGFDEAITDPEECYSVVKETDFEQNQVVWLDYTPFNNTYTIMMRKADADELGIESISDLAAAINEGVEAPSPGEWNLASDHEYFIRDDGVQGLQELYGFEFDEGLPMDAGIVYDSLKEGNVSVSMGFATDGRIAAYEFVNLDDDLKFHPVYNCAPTMRQDTLEALPQIADILNPIAGALDAESMAAMNMKVDIDGYLPAEAAREWLVEQGFIE
ncbi:MAG: glycine betaine ABC transporter substrate-binding protein [Bacillota bacterium]